MPLHDYEENGDGTCMWCHEDLLNGRHRGLSRCQANQPVKLSMVLQLTGYCALPAGHEGVHSYERKEWN